MAPDPLAWGVQAGRKVLQHRPACAMCGIRCAPSGARQSWTLRPGAARGGF
jgi:hypothetical protein